MIINVTVADKVAKTQGAPVIICGNNGYQVTFNFDSEWDNLPNKTARFTWNKNGEKQFTDVEFTGHTVDVPVLVDIVAVYVGVTAGDLHTSTPAKITCQRSILCGGGTKMVKGDPGAAATIAIGTITTGEPGTEAEVENVGTRSAAVLNFTIPQGPTGPAGAAGSPGGPGPKGETGASIVSTELVGQDENGGNIYKQTFDNGATATFTAPRGPAGSLALSGQTSVDSTGATLAEGFYEVTVIDATMSSESRAFRLSTFVYIPSKPLLNSTYIMLGTNYDSDETNGLAHYRYYLELTTSGVIFAKKDVATQLSDGTISKTTGTVLGYYYHKIS